LALLPGTLIPMLTFQEHTIASDLRGGYQVVSADLNRDGHPDLIALAQGMPDLVWFEGPDWKRHVVASGFSQMINLALIESGSSPVIVLASGFSNDARKSPGIISVLEPAGDLTSPWKVTEIDRLPTSHRLRLADIDGSGRKVVVNAPLTAADVVPPDYHKRTPLVYYRPGEWKRRLIGDETEGVMHGIHVIDWDADGRDEILAASFVGIHLYKLGRDDHWIRTEITRARPNPWPDGGASDVAVGRLGQRRFLCSIEPWHGNELVVYLEENRAWRRIVVDDSYVDGHTLCATDLDRDGRDEIVGGYRGAGGGLFLYAAGNAEGTAWEKSELDKGRVAAASCAIADLNGDGKLDIAAIGSASANLKWYEAR
jgi:hypothetical protein